MRFITVSHICISPQKITVPPPEKLILDFWK